MIGEEDQGAATSTSTAQRGGAGGARGAPKPRQVPTPTEGSPGKIAVYSNEGKELLLSLQHHRQSCGPLHREGATSAEAMERAETMKLSGGAKVLAPDESLRAVAIRPKTGSMTTARNQGKALSMLFEEIMGKDNAGKAAFRMEEMALAQRHSEKVYWVIKITPANEETMEALMPKREDGVHEIDLGDVVMPDRSKGSDKGKPLKLEWTWYAPTETHGGVAELTGAEDLGPYHASEVTISGLVDRTNGLNLDDRAAGQVAEQLMKGYGTRKGEGLEAAAERSGYNMSYIYRNMALAGSEAKVESEEQDPRALRPAKLPESDGLGDAQKGARFHLLLRPIKKETEGKGGQPLPIALPQTVPFCNGETLRQEGEQVSWDHVGLDVKTYTVQGQDEKGWKSYDATGHDGRRYTVFATSEESAKGCPGIKCMEEKAVEGQEEEASRGRNYDRGGRKMSERLVEEEDRRMRHRMGAGLCAKSKERLISKNVQETARWRDTPSEREEKMRAGMQDILNVRILEDSATVTCHGGEMCEGFLCKSVAAAQFAVQAQTLQGLGGSGMRVERGPMQVGQSYARAAGGRGREGSPGEPARYSGGFEYDHGRPPPYDLESEEFKRGTGGGSAPMGAAPAGRESRREVYGASGRVSKPTKARRAQRARMAPGSAERGAGQADVEMGTSEDAKRQQEAQARAAATEQAERERRRVKAEAACSCTSAATL